MVEFILMAVLVLPALLAACWYGLLLAAARFARPAIANRPPARRFAILIPAHNEALGLPRTLHSLAALDYPKELLETVVVADNCTDATAAVAAAAGVRVLERFDEHRRGKGFALMHGLAAILPRRPDAVLILDADAELEPAALRVIDARLARAEVVQGAIVTRNPADAASSFVAAVGNVLDNRTAMGRDRLGLRVPLRGSNMAFTREILERVPWTCHGLTEDAEYGDLLHRHGVRVRFEPGAVARSESAASRDALTTQRQRWRMALSGRGLAVWIESKPLLLAHLIAATIITLACTLPGFVSTGWLAPLGVSWLITAAMYLVAIHEVSWRLALRAAAGVPAVILNLLAATCRPGHGREWQRTQRVGEAGIRG